MRSTLAAKRVLIPGYHKIDSHIEKDYPKVRSYHQLWIHRPQLNYQRRTIRLRLYVLNTTPSFTSMPSSTTSPSLAIHILSYSHFFFLFFSTHLHIPINLILSRLLRPHVRRIVGDTSVPAALWLAVPRLRNPDPTKTLLQPSHLHLHCQRGSPD
jgi:hypothetical protein